MSDLQSFRNEVEALVAKFEQDKHHYLAEREKIEREIAVTDDKIDEIVYGLYGITSEERKLLEQHYVWKEQRFPQLRARHTNILRPGLYCLRVEPNEA